MLEMLILWSAFIHVHVHNSDAFIQAFGVVASCACPTYNYIDDKKSTNHIGVRKINVVFSTLSEVRTCISTIPAMCAAHVKCQIVQSLFAATQRSS